MRTSARFLLLVPFLLFAEAASACSCIFVSACKTYQRADAVFVGRAEATHVWDFSVDPVTGAETDRYEPLDEARQRRGEYIGPARVTFKVMETLKGDISTSAEVHGHGLCDYPFEPGTSYIVFTYAQKGKLFAGNCSGTRELFGSSAVVEQLRQLRYGGSAAPIFGNVMQHSKNAELGRYAGPSIPLAGVRVTATAGETFETFTNSDGEFAFESLPIGKYLVKAELPDHLEEPHTRHRLEDGVVVRARDCDSENIRAFSKGAIVGQVLGGVASPWNGTVGLVKGDLSPQRVQEMAERSGYSIQDAVDENAEFQFTNLSPGVYKIFYLVHDAPELLSEDDAEAVDVDLDQIDFEQEDPHVDVRDWEENEKEGSSSAGPRLSRPFYYPGTFDYSKATAFRLEEGQRLEVIWHLNEVPPEPKERP